MYTGLLRSNRISNALWRQVRNSRRASLCAEDDAKNARELGTISQLHGGIARDGPNAYPCRNLNTIPAEVEDDFTALSLTVPALERGSNTKIPILDQLFRILLAQLPVKLPICLSVSQEFLRSPTCATRISELSPQMPSRRPGLVVDLQKSCSASTSSPPELVLGVNIGEWPFQSSAAGKMLS